MCGISGVAGPTASAHTARIMAQAQSHRGPDGAGTWSEPGIALSHRRLKIIDLSDAAAQPMSTPDGRYTIVYNGEVYNYQELRRELKAEFRSQSDSEVVLQAYAAWGPACLERFVGMFAFAIWDSQRRVLFCARDRLGIKPFYYSLKSGHFLFASEIRGLLEAGVKAALEPGVLYDFLARDHYEHLDQTFFKGILKLPAGSWLEVGNGRPGPIRSYWDLAAESRALDIPSDPRARQERLLELCGDAVASSLRSDVPVGIMLSGGLDSATLLSLVDRKHEAPERVESFSFVFDEERYSERPYVEAMARHTGRKAHFSSLSPREFADNAQADCASQEEPFAGLPISSYARCFKLARDNGFIVLMDGTGLDEALGGYERFRPSYWADLRDSGVPADQAAAMAGVDAERAALDEIGRGQDLSVSARPECLSEDFSRACGKPPAAYDSPFPDRLRNLMHRELRHTKLPRALRFRDRLSMAVGCELRPPFLDHRLLAYAFALPASDLIQGKQSKAILRQASRLLLPENIRLAPKRSVQTPQREWLRGPLQDWARQIVDSPGFWQRGWVDRQKGLAAMEAFFRGESDNSFFIWQWINLELWARMHLDRNAPASTVIR
ncbi:MAG: asparagine synthase (glutamine-hydrolyzing) [Elusimicrobia bacterium]|nr:asparagine synthase (glutamine-hydrolyzing) [Elusimicrobiota bacterium]